MGAAIVAALEDEARAHRCRAIYLRTERERDFFARLGYAPARQATLPRWRRVGSGAIRAQLCDRQQSCMVSKHPFGISAIDAGASRDRVESHHAPRSDMPHLRDVFAGPWRAVLVLGVTQILAWGAIFYPPVLTVPLIAAERGWSMTFAMGGFSLALLTAGLASPRVGAADRSATADTG